MYIQDQHKINKEKFRYIIKNKFDKIFLLLKKYIKNLGNKIRQKN